MKSVEIGEVNWFCPSIDYWKAFQTGGDADDL
jgi:hypothetical protein